MNSLIFFTSLDIKIVQEYYPYLVLIIIFILFFLIYKEILRPGVSFLLAILIFTIVGILEADEVLSGLSNQAIASIILLILITGGLRKNFRLEYLFDRIFRKAQTYRGFLLRMMSQVAILSSGINNTPVVALMTPYVFDWGKKHNIAPSKLLIPLSFATIMGGMITIIGTSTTLVLNGFLYDFNLTPINPLDLFIIGTIVTIIGIVFIVFFGNKLLPDHKDTMQNFANNQREYLVETRLSGKSKLIGQSVKGAGLRNLEGVYLVEIHRGNNYFSPVPPYEILQRNDTLIFAGDTDNIMDLVRSNKGLSLPKDAHDYNKDQNEVIEAVVGGNSYLIGRTVKEAEFRNRYDAAIIAIHRSGERISGKIGEIEIEAGDVLLVYSGPDFQNRVDLYRDMFIISKIRQIADPGRKKTYALILIIIGALVLLITKGLTLFPSLLIIFSIMVGFGLITLQDVRRELDFNMIGILVFSLAIGQAMIKTGAGTMVATWFIDVLHPYGTLAILAGLMIITNIITSLIGNIGAVSISFPLALGISLTLGVDGAPFFLAVAYAAAGAFVTPISYQTNLIIYGPGGYKFKDFLRIGGPVVLIYLTVTFLLIVTIYKDYLIN
ncbi:SLC13 family permease [Bacteroidota bacterium]